MPKLEDFGFTKNEISKGSDLWACYPFKGGEEKGLQRLDEYLYKRKSIANYE